MGVIIKIKSPDFFEFIKKYNVENYRFLLLSDEITTRNGYENVTALKNLIPPPSLYKLKVDGFEKDYGMEYIKYLKSDQCTNIINSIVHEALNTNKDVVLLFSEVEDETDFPKILSDFILDRYGLKIFSYKKYKKKQCTKCKLKCTLCKKSLSYDKKDAEKLLNKRIKKCGKEFKTLEDRIEIYKKIKEGIVKKINDMDKKELIKFCESHGYLPSKAFKRKIIIEEFTNQVLNKYIF